MAFKIEDFKSKMKFGGARPSLFEVSIDGATQFGLSEGGKFFIEAAQLPASNLGVIQVPYFGRIVKLAGDRQFDPWTVTVINEEDFNLRNALEEWSGKINSLQGNERDFVYLEEENYKKEATVTQYGKNGPSDVLRRYKFHGLFPQVVGAIDLNWQSLDEIERFQVTFEYDYFTIDTPTNVDVSLRADS